MILHELIIGAARSIRHRRHCHESEMVWLCVCVGVYLCVWQHVCVGGCIRRKPL